MNLLLTYIKQHKKMLFAALGLATINQSFSLMDPQLFRLIIDNYATKVGELQPREFATGVGLLLAASVGVALVSRLAKNFQDYYVNVITQKVGTKMYADAVTHSFSLEYAVFEDQRSGELLQKIQKARQDSQKVIQSSINVLFLSLVGMLIVVAYALWVNWMIGLAFISLVPAMGIITFFVSKKIEAAQKEIVTESADLAGSTTETLRNVELVKSLGLEEQETKRLNNVNDKILALELKKVTLVRMLSFVQGSLVNASRSAIMLLMLWFVFTGNITLGQFFTLLFYSFFVFQPLYQLDEVVSSYQEAKASMKILDQVLAMKPAPKPTNPKTISEVQNITFNKVGFNYSDKEQVALDNISLEIKKGQTVALVGPSGSGKSTMIKMLVGLYTPQQGQILFNNIPSTEIDFDSLRKKIGYVSQDTQLFAGTIRDNLLFVSPQATDQQCIEALNAAAALKIINRTEQGLDTKIGEGGIKLSGGEKQRLAIARALLRNPHLIIFDEATSSLDSITEQSITQTIQEISQNRPDLITVLVAHRLSTVSHADTIYVLEKGKIIEQGSHQKLNDISGLYAALWRQQSAMDQTQVQLKQEVVKN